MTFAGWSAGEVCAAFAAAGAAITALYLLKLRRRRIEVSFVALWERVLHTREATSLWHRLRRVLSLLVQLTLLALLLLAVGDPVPRADRLGSRTLVILVDASASMQVREGSGGDREDEAKRAANELIDGMSAGDQAMVMQMDGRVTPLSPFTGEARPLKDAVAQVTASDAPADLPGALRAAADALRRKPHPEIVLIGDGAYPSSALAAIRISPATGARAAAESTTEDTLGVVDLSGVDLRFIPVGRASDNVGIVAFSGRRYPGQATAYEAFVEIESFRENPCDVRLAVTANGVPVDAEVLHLPPHGRIRRILSDLVGSDPRLVARLAPTSGDGALDAFPLDDTAYALVPSAGPLHVLLVTSSDLYTEGALLLDPSDVDLVRESPAEYATREAKSGHSASFDAVVLDGYVPDSLPRSRGVILLGAHGSASPIPIAGELASPVVDQVRRDHPTMRWLALQDANFSASAVFAPAPHDVVLASAEGAPVIVAREADGQRLVATGFDPRRSDLVLRAAYPLFLVNCLDWIAGDHRAGVVAAYRTGSLWSVPIPSWVPESADIDVLPPRGGGLRAVVRDGRAVFYGSTAGFTTLQLRPARSGTEGFSLTIAANLASAGESEIGPRADLRVAGPGADRATPGSPVASGAALLPPERRAHHERSSIWALLVAAAAGIALFEWLSYHRRWTV